LRRADENFDEVIVQRVVELTLEAPFELGMVEVAGMEVEVIGMHPDRGVLELDDYFHAFAFGARREIQQRMLVEAQLGEDTVEARGGGFGHRGIVKQDDSQRGTPALLVAQRFDRIQHGCFDRRQHAADYSYEAEDRGRPNQRGGVDVEVNIAFGGIFDEGAP